jgi:hypothetical protein
MFELSVQSVRMTSTGVDLVSKGSSLLKPVSAILFVLFFFFFCFPCRGTSNQPAVSPSSELASSAGCERAKKRAEWLGLTKVEK